MNIYSYLAALFPRIQRWIPKNRLIYRNNEILHTGSDRSLPPKENKNTNLCELWIKAETTISPQNIPVTIKTKNIFCHCVQIFMWILRICEPNFEFEINLIIGRRWLCIDTNSNVIKFIDASGKFFFYWNLQICFKKSARK